MYFLFFFVVGTGLFSGGLVAWLTEETLRWEAPRRLSQLRGELHNRIKFSMEANEYRALFDDTPFAHSGGDLAVGDNKTRGRLFYPTAVV